MFYWGRDTDGHGWGTPNVGIGNLSCCRNLSIAAHCMAAGSIGIEACECAERSGFSRLRAWDITGTSDDFEPSEPDDDVPIILSILNLLGSGTLPSCRRDLIAPFLEWSEGDEVGDTWGIFKNGLVWAPGITNGFIGRPGSLNCPLGGRSSGGRLEGKPMLCIKSKLLVCSGCLWWFVG